MIRRTGLVACFVTICVLAPTSSASGNTAIIGSDLSQLGNSSTCIGECTGVQLAQAGGSTPFPLTSPANGLVTEWAYRSTDTNAQFSFRILRPAGPNTYTGAGTAPAPTPDPGSEAILRYAVSPPIQQGDAIGITGSGDLDAGLPQHDTPTTTSNVWATNAMGLPPDGGTASFTPQAGHELLLQATVKFCSVPSLKRLKKVTAKQALAASDCGVKVKKRMTHKRKFRGKVLKQKTPAGTTAAPGTVVPIVIGRK